MDETRGKYKELVENFHKLKSELNNVRRRLKEQEMVFDSIVDWKRKCFRLFLQTETSLRAQLTNDEELKRHLKRLQAKYDEVCQRLNEKSIELTRVQMSLEQKSNLCEQLEKEKVKNKGEIINQIDQSFKKQNIQLI